MNATVDETIAPKCYYCGRENPERLSACARCGSALVSGAPSVDAAPRRKRKDETVALALALIFGPLGLFYASFSGGMIMLAVAAVIYGTHHAGLWFAITVRIVSIAWAHLAVRKLNTSDTSATLCLGPGPLIQEAARLEDVDMAKAISVYQEIVRLFPGTPQSKEAARTLESLTSQHKPAAEPGVSPKDGPAMRPGGWEAGGGPPIDELNHSTTTSKDSAL